MDKYKANIKDFLAIQEGIKLIYGKELSSIFKEKNLFKNLTVVSYDSSFIYAWSSKALNGFKTIPYPIGKFKAQKIAHNLNIPTKERLGWKAGVTSEQILQLLPKKLHHRNFKFPIISGGLLGDFIDIQEKSKGIKNNPYITKESYIATIIHEFGHIYYQQHKNWWYSNKKENIDLLDKAKELFRGKMTGKTTKILLPSPLFLTEVFAFCCEYYASTLLLDKHRKNLDKYYSKMIEELIAVEKKKDLENMDSTLGDKYPHNTAFTLGKIILDQYPNSWPQRLLDKHSL